MTETTDDGKQEKKSAATVLVEMAEKLYELGTSTDGEAFAYQPDSHVVRPLRGGKSGLRAELAKQYFRTTGKAAPQQALADAMNVLEGIAAEFDPTPLHLRVAEHHGTVYVDVGDVAENIIRISANGWEFGEVMCPVKFRRTVLTGAFPKPEQGGSIAELWELLNIAAPDHPLVVAWLVASIIAPGIPHPIMANNGEQGAAKTSTSKALVALCDPSPVPVRKPPRDVESWVTAASGSHVVAVDNISGIPDWLSDSFCRAVTGDGDVKRQLYTDSGLAIVSFRRSLILNGIDWGAMRGDLAERIMLVNLLRIPKESRKSEAELGARWELSYPRVLGALLDLCAAVVGVLPSVELRESPRMADFAHILAAVDRVLGTEGLAHYLAQAATLAADTIAADPFLSVVAQKITARFDGTAAELLHKVTPDDPHWRAPRDWPKSPRTVTGLLKRAAPALRSTGWQVWENNPGAKHPVQWTLVPERR